MDWESLVWATSLPPTRKFLLVAIARQADTSGFAPITTRQLAAMTGLGDRTVRDQMSLAEMSGSVRRFPRIGFQITLTQPDSPSGATRRIANLEAELPAAMRNYPPHGISAPYKERTSEGPFGASSSSNPNSLSSPEVQENKGLGHEGISIGQGELILTDVPAWLTDLRTTPGYDVDRVHEMKLIDRVRDAGISPQRLCETAASIAAKWESIRWSPSNKGGYKRIDLTFIAWAKRESFNGAKSTNGRYVAPGTSIPKGGTPEAHARWPEQTYDDDGNVLTTRW